MSPRQLWGWGGGRDNCSECTAAPGYGWARKLYWNNLVAHRSQKVSSIWGSIPSVRSSIIEGCSVIMEPPFACIDFHASPKSWHVSRIGWLAAPALKNFNGFRKDPQGIACPSCPKPKDGSYSFCFHGLDSQPVELNGPGLVLCSFSFTCQQFLVFGFAGMLGTISVNSD